jgi:hypothetical protein
LFALFVILNVYYAQKITSERYSGPMNNYGKLNDSYTITPFLRESGIGEYDTVISIPDGSHVSLYLMNQKGWTEYSDARLNREEPILYNRDSLGIQKSINHGAKFLIVNGIKQLYDKPYLQSFCTHLKARYNNTLVFDLLEEEINFDLQEREVSNVYFCGAEVLVGNKKEYLGQDSVIFKNGETQSSDYVLNGDYSCKLLKDAKYGLTIVMKDLQFGESFQISVWRKKSVKGYIIASATDYYNNDFDVVKTNNSWEKLQMDIFINRELEDKELAIYLYNPDEEPVYFDDFRIVKFKSVVL